MRKALLAEMRLQDELIANLKAQVAALEADLAITVAALKTNITAVAERDKRIVELEAKLHDNVMIADAAYDRATQAEAALAKETARAERFVEAYTAISHCHEQLAERDKQIARLETTLAEAHRRIAELEAKRPKFFDRGSSL